MKKTLILLLSAATLMLAGVKASAQISIGADPATRLYFDDKVSYTYGVQLSFEDSMRLSDLFAYSAGVDFGTYSKKDFQIPGVTLSEMYLDLPVRAKLYLPFGGDFEFFFFGGIAPSVCLSSHNNLDTEKFTRFGEKSSYSRYDILAGGGIGLEVAERIKFTLGYDHGLLNRDKVQVATGGPAMAGSLHVAAAKLNVAFMF